MEEKTEQIKTLEKQAERVKKLKHFFSILLKICPVVFSLIALLFSVSPQIFFSHSNYLKKAEAGHIKSQVFLADYYYEVGDTSESIYWYKIVAMHSGKHQARALNNLAVLYSRQEIQYPYEANYYKCLEVELFRQAVENKQAKDEQRLIAAQNMFYTLVSLPDSVFSSIPYDDELKWVKDYLATRDEYTPELSQYEDSWIPVDTIPDPDTLEEGMEILEYQEITGYWPYTPVDGNGIQIRPVYITKYVIHKTKAEIPELMMLFD